MNEIKMKTKKLHSLNLALILVLGCFIFGIQPAHAALIYGDVSQEGTITAYDAALTAQSAVGSVDLTPDQLTAADVSGDNQVTAFDAALIAQYTVGLINIFPAEDIAASKVLVPGNGWTGPTEQPAAIGSGTGVDAKAIARWDVVPYQTFDTTFNVGVVAFHINGIDRAEFSVNNGPWLKVTQMTLNPQTANHSGIGVQSDGVAEYWATLRASDFQDGPVEVRAIAYPAVGVPRVLDSLVLFANTQPGQYAPVYASVSLAGNDVTGAVSTDWDTAKGTPFATIGVAATAIRAKRAALFGQDNPDGGIIRLSPDVHAWDDNGSWSSHLKGGTNRWLTIEPEPNNSPTDTIIRGHNTGMPSFQFLRIRNIRMESVAVSYLVNDNSYVNTALLWLDGNVIVGTGQWLSNSGVVGLNWKGVYYTNNDISQVDFGTRNGIFARGNYIHDIGDDAFRLVDVVIHNTVDNIDPGATGNHSDLWQRWGGHDDNVIFYDCIATNLKYQGIFFGLDMPGQTDSVDMEAHGVAIVNVSISGENLNDPTRPWSMIFRFMDHFVLSGNSFNERTIMLSGTINNFRAVNNHFRKLDLHGSLNTSFDLWDSNSFQIIKGDPGADGLTSGLLGTNAVHGQ